MELAQKFEDELLGLLLAVRKYKDANKTKDSLKFIIKDLTGTAGRTLTEIFRDTQVIALLTRKTFLVWEPDTVQSLFRAAVRARNNLAHNYLRSHSFSSETAESLVKDLFHAATLFQHGAFVAEALRSRMTAGPSRKPFEHLRREIQSFLSKIDREEFHELVEKGPLFDQLVSETAAGVRKLLDPA